MKTTNITDFCLSWPHLQVPDQTRPTLSGTQSGQQQKVQRWALREPQVRYAGQHPSVKDRKKTCTVKTLPERREKNNTRKRDSRNGEAQRDVARWHMALVFILGQLRGHAWTFSNDGNVFIYAPFSFQSGELQTQKCI